jgi:hypothetical protein
VDPGFHPPGVYIPPPGFWTGNPPPGGYPSFEAPPTVGPIPPDITAPPENPGSGTLPDMASPGFWCQVIDGTSRSVGFIQTLLITSPDHEPKPPEKGVPGTWRQVYGGNPPAVWDCWIPTPPSEVPPDQGGGGGEGGEGKTRKKHSPTP